MSGKERKEMNMEEMDKVNGGFGVIDAIQQAEASYMKAKLVEVAQSDTVQGIIDTVKENTVDKLL